MLKGLLQLFTDDDVYSVAELARNLEVSEALTLRMIEDLAQLGYLQPVDRCGAAHCVTCHMAETCGIGGPLHIWALTEKGSKTVMAL